MDRLTKYDSDIGYYVDESLVDEYATNITSVDNFTIVRLGEAITKLAELENMIEEGELVEVIRCKDCIEWNEEDRFNDTKVCGFWSSNRNHVYTEPDEFCSCGERRTK